ncbi:MAG TPA: glycosyltransferase family 2 protein, partial [Candidatus Paceibacterota bacterium]
PFYKEGPEVLAETIEALLNSRFDHRKMIVTLGCEERAGKEAERNAKMVEEKYAHRFGFFLVTKHPKDLPGEMAGKGSNIAYAAKETRKKILDPNNIPYENIIVSAFDIDTHVYPQYFLCLTWHFLTAEDPYHSSFQPVPVYNNNIWEAPALARVVAVSGTFWQMIQQERPERLATFSSHSMSFKAVHDAGYWQKNIVSEDSRIFWNMLLHFNGNYRVIPISYPISLDANFAGSFWRTALNNYKQQRRWTWGVENVPYLLFGFVKNHFIPRRKRLRLALLQLEGFWSLATNPLIIFFLGWLPLALGGTKFNKTLVSYNLPNITRDLMIIAMSGLVVSAAISLSFLPPRPKGKGRHNYIFMVLQWLFIPLTIPLLGAIPGLDSQTRLMLGKYMGFWVTPKFRK